MIQIRNISKSFKNKNVLLDINFSLKKGEVTAFLGANGAGKTTTMNILSGILTPDEGEVLFDGVNLLDNPIEIKKRIGYLPENNPLYGDMYVKEYLEYVADIYLPKSETKESVDRVIELVDLKSEYNKKINTLSYGNKQRVGLAQAVVHNPDVLILDEPTNGLDPSQQFRVNNLIRKIGESKIVLFSSHRLDDVQNIASHYLLLKEGKLVLDESASNINSIEEYFYKNTQ